MTKKKKNHIEKKQTLKNELKKHVKITIIQNEYKNIRSAKTRIVQSKQKNIKKCVKTKIIPSE
jgi:hypothetical protein